MDLALSSASNADRIHIRNAWSVSRLKLPNLSKCLLCKRQKAPLLTQQMAPALLEQVAVDDPPFAHTGVDFFGPVQVKFGRSTVKQYGCIFTCLAMRAVHLEVVHTLNNDSFLAAISRFIARRGIPAQIFSDNGNNS